MNIRKHFLEIKHQFFSRWDRDDRWRITTRSRRKAHGHCDPMRQVIEIMIQHNDPDEQEMARSH